MRSVNTAHVALVWVILGIVGSAQTTWRPAPPPSRSAADAEWYLAREPILVAGEWYYPAGPTRFFDAGTMAQVGWYDGVPLYADTTLEPHSIVYVPVGRGLLQPYERPRAGQLAGTVGSRTPSFPVQRDFEVRVPVQYWDYAWFPEYREPARDALERATPLIGRPPYEPEPVAAATGALRSAQPPQGSWGVWIAYEGARWTSAGQAMPLEPGHFERVGEYCGFDVFRLRRGAEDVVYLPSRGGLVAPYRRSGPM